MNMCRTIAAAFGAALLGAGASAVYGGAAHGQLNHNKSGTATSSQTGAGGTATASFGDPSPAASIDASATLTSAAGFHQNNGHISQDVHGKLHSGNANGTTHGSARSGSQKFHIG